MIINRWNKDDYELFTIKDPRIKISTKHFYKGTPCWEWLQALDKEGYGVAWFKGTVLKAHQAFYYVNIGKVQIGTQLHHRCEYKRCCNFSHIKTMSSKKHNQLHKRVLSKRIVRKMRKEYGIHSTNGEGRSHKNVSMQSLADKYDVCLATVYKVISKRGYINV